MPKRSDLIYSHRPAWVAGRLVIGSGLAVLLALGALLLSGCARGRCRDSVSGRFARCGSAPEVRPDIMPGIKPHGYPTEAEVDAAHTKANFFRCRDANGITWESHGECD